MSAARDAINARNQELCERIRQGDADEGDYRAALLTHLRRTVREKIAVSNPALAAEEGAG